MRMFLVAQAFKLPHVHEVTEESEETILVPVSGLQTKWMCFQVKNKMLICTFPNARERLNYMIDSTVAKNHMKMNINMKILILI